MKQFHPLTVAGKTAETRDSVRIALEVPEALREEFAFLPGQHLPLRFATGGKQLRRTYSICSTPGAWPLEIGVRVQPGGAFSEHAVSQLGPGDTLEVMPPFGQFHARPDAGNEKFYLAFAAGSGITPILSIVSTILAVETRSRVCLFYGNRKQATTMFIEDLFALKNRFPGRLQLTFVFSQEEQEFPIAAGRLDGDKVHELWQCFCRGDTPDEAFICGPDTMIDSVRDSLLELGMNAENVHAERFGVPRATVARPAVQSSGDAAEITVIMDGHRKSFTMAAGDANIVDAAAGHGIDLPYSCKGGVCATCRCHVLEGEVSMATNYGLEPWEVAEGFVLACQSTPVSKTVTLDYDTV